MDYLKKISAVGVMAVLLVALQAYGFTEPTLPPPDGNVSAPLNTGGAAQGKLGMLIVNQHTNADSGLGLLVHKGTAQFGSIASSVQRVGVKGKVKIEDGSQGDKKLFVSDANGLGTWKAFGSIGPECPPGTNCTSLPDGTIIQWGVVTGNNVKSRPVTLVKSYASPTAYVVQVTGADGNAIGQDCQPGVKRTGAGTFTVDTDDNCNNVVFQWQSIGR